MAKLDVDFIGDLETRIGFDLVDDGVQVMSSTLFEAYRDASPFNGGAFPFTPMQPMLIVFETVQSGHALPIHPHADAVATTLGLLFPSGHEVLAFAGGVIEGTIDGIAGMHRVVALYVPAVDSLQAGADPRAMQHIVARLRQPDGCPWDRKQTHESLRKAVIDETYEVVDAIDRGDPANLAEELGDMFLLILMQAQIAHEAGEFSIEDVYRGITNKIVGRHPHVFGDHVAGDADDVVGIWAEAKAREKAANGTSGAKDIDGEPFSMPALTRAARVLNKHPIVVDDNTPPLLATIARIVGDGGDPDAMLMQQLRDHVNRNE